MEQSVAKLNPSITSVPLVTLLPLRLPLDRELDHALLSPTHHNRSAVEIVAHDTLTPSLVEVRCIQQMEVQVALALQQEPTHIGEASIPRLNNHRPGEAKTI